MQRKLKGYVLPTVYVVLLMLIFATVSLVSTLFTKEEDITYSTSVMEDVTTTVINQEETEEITGIIKPYTDESVSIEVSFYDMNKDAESQENALIYYENTYMKNTGVLYSSDTAFDVVAVLDGTITNVTTDEILGNVVEIEHSTNLKTIYYSIDEVGVSVGDTILQGGVFAMSGSNSLSTSANNLLFEVYYNGTLIDPEEFYNMNIEDLF